LLLTISSVSSNYLSLLSFCVLSSQTYCLLTSPLFLALACFSSSGFHLSVPHCSRQFRPYELRICDKCDWHTLLEEEHSFHSCWTVCMNILLAFAHSTASWSSHSQDEDSPSRDGQARLRIFLNQPDMYGVASFVAECLAFSPLIILAPYFDSVTRFSKLPPEAYIPM